MWRDYGDDILTYPRPTNVYISSQQVQPDQKGETDMLTAYKIEDANGVQGITYKDREKAWNEFMDAPTPAKLYENRYVLSPRGEFVKVGSELLFTRK